MRTGAEAGARNHMAAAPPNPAAETKQKVEQIIRESIVKVVQLVVGARCTLPSSGKINKWVRARACGSHLLTSAQFNTATEEVEALTEELAHWRKNIFAPLLLNVYLDLDAVGESPTGRGGLLLERWKLLFDQRSGTDLSPPPSSCSPAAVQRFRAAWRCPRSTRRPWC